MTQPRAKLNAWEQSLSRLSPFSRSVVERLAKPLPLVTDPPEDPDRQAWLDSRKRLSPVVKISQDPAEAPEEPPTTTAKLRHLLVVCPDGEPPRLLLFGDKSAEGVSRKIGELDGEDVYVFPIFGMPLAFSQGPIRWLTLPNGYEAMSVPRNVFEPIRVTPVSTIGDAMELQDDCFLGTEPLSRSEMESAGLPPEIRRKRQQEEDDEGQLSYGDG